MNITSVQDYMVRMNNEKFDGLLDLSKVEFRPSKDDGILIDLENGRHTLRIGRRVSVHQQNRALVVMLLDRVFELKNESERAQHDYREYGGKVSQVQEHFFPTQEVFVERDGRIIKDNIIDCDAFICNLKESGPVKKEELIGRRYTEVEFKEK